MEPNNYLSPFPCGAWRHNLNNRDFATGLCIVGRFHGLKPNNYLVDSPEEPTATASPRYILLL